MAVNDNRVVSDLTLANRFRAGQEKIGRSVPACTAPWKYTSFAGETADFLSTEGESAEWRANRPLWWLESTLRHSRNIFGPRHVSASDKHGPRNGAAARHQPKPDNGGGDGIGARQASAGMPRRIAAPVTPHAYSRLVARTQLETLRSLCGQLRPAPGASSRYPRCGSAGAPPRIAQQLGATERVEIEGQNRCQIKSDDARREHVTRTHRDGDVIGVMVGHLPGVAMASMGQKAPKRCSAALNVRVAARRRSWAGAW